MIKAVIFDYDGVLVDTLDIVRKVYTVIGKEMGIDKWTKLGDKVDSFNVDWRETCKGVGLSSGEEIEKVEGIFIREFRKIAHETKVFPGIREVIKELDGFKKGVLSNNFRTEIEKVLENLNLNHFDSIVGVEDGKPKPDPELYNVTMRKLNVNPEETVYICDMKEEIIGAKRAKIKKTIAVSYGYHSKEHLEEANPDHIVDTPEDILPLIKEDF